MNGPAHCAVQSPERVRQLFAEVGWHPGGQPRRILRKKNPRSAVDLISSLCLAKTEAADA